MCASVLQCVPCVIYDARYTYTIAMKLLYHDIFIVALINVNGLSIAINYKTKLLT